MKIYLDDKRTPINKDWTVVRSYHDFIFIVNQSFDVISAISLDYHLNDSISPDKTGLDCAKYLINYCNINCKVLPQINVHDDFITGVQEIIHLVNNHLFFHEKFPTCRWYHIEN